MSSSIDSSPLLDSLAVPSESESESEPESASATSSRGPCREPEDDRIKGLNGCIETDPMQSARPYSIRDISHGRRDRRQGLPSAICCSNTGTSEAASPMPQTRSFPSCRQVRTRQPRRRRHANRTVHTHDRSTADPPPTPIHAKLDPLLCPSRSVKLRIWPGHRIAYIVHPNRV
jgi:hypothetical protein